MSSANFSFQDCDYFVAVLKPKSNLINRIEPLLELFNLELVDSFLKLCCWQYLKSLFIECEQPNKEDYVGCTVSYKI